MKFSISVHSDDNTQVDYTNQLLSASDAVKFIKGWQKEQDKLQKQSEFWHKVWLVSTVIFVISRIVSLFIK